MIRIFKDMALALQFMTRVPISLNSLDPSRLDRAAAWFPLMGLFVGGLASLCYRFFALHLERPVCALIVLLIMVLITGGLHEDALADCSDAFGGGWRCEDRLRILKDSHIGSFGAVALILSFGFRGLLLATLPANQVVRYIISAQVLSRWTSLPLGAILPSARGTEGQGGRLAGKISWTAVAIGTIVTAVVLWYLLRASVWQPILVVAIVTVVSGIYFQRRIGGITGDCLGATIQISEVAVYLCGAWM